MVTTVVVPVEEALTDIGINPRNLVIDIQCVGDISCAMLLGEGWPTHSDTSGLVESLTHHQLIISSILTVLLQYSLVPIKIIEGCTQILSHGHNM